MKKFKRKMLMLFCLCFAVICCALPLNACSDGEKPFEKVEGTAGLEYTLSDDGEYYYLSGLGEAKDEEEIVIANYYNDKPVKQVGKYVFKTTEEGESILADNLTDDDLSKLFFFTDSKVKRVTVSEGITTIGAYAFLRNKEESIIETISLPSSVSYIGYSAFYGCSLLSSITIPNAVTQIGEFAFFGCISLTSITIPNAVTQIGKYTFARCSLLTNITIPNTVTQIGEFAFNGCTSLTSIAIPDGVTSIGDGAFYDCPLLKSIIIPNRITSIGDRAFGRCNSLTIYCKAEKQPSGWNENWNYSDCPVVWGYKG